jgi:hypothetical protein
MVVTADIDSKFFKYHSKAKKKSHPGRELKNMTENMELKAFKAIYNAKIAAKDAGPTLNPKVR